MSEKPPTYLFRPAWQATLPPVPPSSPTSTSSASSSSPSVARTATSVSSSSALDLERRQAAGTCRADESTCPQAGWCCNKSEACSLEGGAFFCCPTGAGKEGCARVCAAGDFQCGGTSPDTTGICCANGQTCIGGDTPLPFCADTGTSSSRRTTTSLSTSQPSTSSHSDSHLSTTNTTLLPSSTLDPNLFSSSPPFTIPTATIHPSPSPTETPSPGSGFSIPAQITAIIIPLVIITLIAACIFRHRRKKQRGTRIHSTDSTEQNNTSSGTTTGTGNTTNFGGLSFYSAYSSYPKTPPPPPPTFSAGRVYGRDTKEEDGEVMSLHERYMMKSRMFRMPTPQSPVGQGVGRGL